MFRFPNRPDPRRGGVTCCRALSVGRPGGLLGRVLCGCRATSLTRPAHPLPLTCHLQAGSLPHGSASRPGLALPQASRASSTRSPESVCSSPRNPQCPGIECPPRSISTPPAPSSSSSRDPPCQATFQTRLPLPGLMLYTMGHRPQLSACRLPLLPGSGPRRGSVAITWNL